MTRLRRTSLAFALSACASCALAAPGKSTFTGPDLSGTYDCAGDDASEGAYTGTAKLELVRAQSSGDNGAYSFLLEVPGDGSYPGHAAGSGTILAIHFALTDPSTHDFGTGIARFTRTLKGKWRFDKYYYEPEFKGGNHGREHCEQR